MHLPPYIVCVRVQCRSELASVPARCEINRGGLHDLSLNAIYVQNYKLLACCTARPELIVHSNLPIIQILCSHLSSLLFK